jgi:hypothetical protein
MLAAFKKPHKKHTKEDSHRNSAFDAYVSTLQLFKASDIVIFVLDSRNPIASRYVPFEALLPGRFLFVLNKVDLVPRESNLGWLRALSGVTLSFALQANKDATCLTNYLNRLRKENGKINITVAGIARVGKHTLSQSIAQLDHVTVTVAPSWTWLDPTTDLILLSACDCDAMQNRTIEAAKDFIGRCSIYSLMDVFHVTFFNDYDRVLLALNQDRRTAAVEFLQGMIAGRWHYFAMPPAKFTSGSLDGLTDEQVLALRNSRTYDTCKSRFVFLSYGTPNGISPVLVPLIENLIISSKPAEETDAAASIE